MEFKASHRYAPLSARKVRPVMTMVRGLPVDAALEALRTTHRRGALMIGKVIRSAVANAEQEKAMASGDLFIKVGLVNEGPLKQGRIRWRAGAMGRMKPFRKRTSHIEVVLGVKDEGTGSRRSKKAAKGQGEEDAG